MWSFLIFVILGIFLSVSNANGWFVVPDFCVYVCFGVAAVIFVIWLSSIISTRKAMKEIRRKL